MKFRNSTKNAEHNFIKTEQIELKVQILIKVENNLPFSKTNI